MKHFNIKKIPLLLLCIVAFGESISGQFYQIADKQSSNNKTDYCVECIYEFDPLNGFNIGITFDPNTAEDIWSNLIGKRNKEVRFGKRMQEEHRKEFERMFNRKFDSYNDGLVYFFEQYSLLDNLLGEEVAKYTKEINGFASTFNEAAEQLRVLDSRELEIRSGNINTSYLPNYDFGGIKNLSLKTVDDIVRMRNQALNTYNAMDKAINQPSINYNRYAGIQGMSRNRVARQMGLEYANEYYNIIWNVRDGAYEAQNYIKDFILYYYSILYQRKNESNCNRELGDICPTQDRQDELEERGWVYQENRNVAVQNDAYENGKDNPPYVPNPRTLEQINGGNVFEKLSKKVNDYLAENPELRKTVFDVQKLNNFSPESFITLQGLLEQIFEPVRFEGQDPNGAFPQPSGYFRNLENDIFFINDYARSVYGSGATQSTRSQFQPNNVVRSRINPSNSYRTAYMGFTEILKDFPDGPYKGAIINDILISKNIIGLDTGFLRPELMAKYFDFNSTLDTGLDSKGLDFMNIGFKRDFGARFWNQGLIDYKSVFGHINNVEAVGTFLDLDFKGLEVLLDGKDLAKALAEFLRRNTRDSKATEYAKFAYNRANAGQPPVDLDCYDSTTGNADKCNKTWYLDNDGDGFYSEIREAQFSPGIRWKENLTQVDCDDTKPELTDNCASTKNPCDEIRKQLENVAFNNAFQELKKQTNKREESGFSVDNNNKQEQATVSNDGHRINFRPDPNVVGYMHTHINSYPDRRFNPKTKQIEDVTVMPVKIFSPQDLITFLKLVRNTQNPRIQKDVEDVFVGVVTSQNSYFLKFTGEASSVESLNLNPSTKEKDELNSKFKELIRRFSLERAFLLFVKENFATDGIGLFKVQNAKLDKIQLQRRLLNSDGKKVEKVDC